MRVGREDSTCIFGDREVDEDRLDVWNEVWSYVDNPFPRSHNPRVYSSLPEDGGPVRAQPE